MYRQFNRWLKGKDKHTLGSCTVVGGGVAAKCHIAFCNVDIVNAAQPSNFYRNEQKEITSNRAKSHQYRPQLP